MIPKSVKMEGWIDISMPLRTKMVTWPGDPPVIIKKSLDLDLGDKCNSSMISMGLHTGTHIDSPLHFISHGKGVNEMPFDATVGTARVIEICDNKCIRIEELQAHHIRKGERILFKTKNSTLCWDSDRFLEDYVYISHRAAKFLVDKKVRTVGIDYLSVGRFDDEADKTHHTLLKGGIWIIEGLDLSKVVYGRYHLICLPIKILKSDGAPARAIMKLIKS